MKNLQNNKVAKNIATIAVFGMVGILGVGIFMGGIANADEEKSSYVQQLELAQKTFEQTGDAHYQAKCSLAQAKQIARAHGLDVEGNPSEWDAIIQECLGKK